MNDQFLTFFILVFFGLVLATGSIDRYNDDQEKRKRKTRTMNRNDYLTLLRDNICVVTFTKRDGTERVMRCTLKTEHLPTPTLHGNLDEKLLELKKTKIFRKPSETSISVWDMDKNAWRGFTLDSVKEIKQES